MGDITEGWYIPKPAMPPHRRFPRWVLGQYRNVICYSLGGVTHRMCQLETFQKWLRRTGAELATELRARGEETERLKELRHNQEHY